MSAATAQHGSAASREPVRLGTLACALVAVLCSAALAAWVISGDRQGPGRAGSTARPAQPVSYAPAEPDRTQVEGAYAQVRELYGDGGMPAVMEVVNGCRLVVAATPSKLDFCIAFALDAAALADRSGDLGAKLWSQSVMPGQLALVRGALPAGADPSARVAAVQQLTHALFVDGGPAQAFRGHSGLEPIWGAEHPGLLFAKSGRGRAQARLRAEAKRLRSAYERALARSSDPLRLERRQARWEAQVNAAAKNPKRVARLYHTRLRELAAASQTRRHGHRAKLWAANLEVPPY